jgi:hypothetical protein
MLPNPVRLTLDSGGLDFQQAQEAAKKIAKTHSDHPLLLSWFDKKAGRYSPQDVMCCTEGKPSWVEYASSRGGNLSVDINNEEFVFVFRV